jgi:hypothetical protein
MVLPEGVDEALQVQIAACEQLGSPLYAELLRRAREDLQAGGVVARVLDGWTGKPVADALPLRLLGAAHRIVLDGRAPRLAAHFPSAGGSVRLAAAWDALRETLETHCDEVRRRLNEPVQTNEVNRCAALLGGFLAVAARTRLPLRLCEIGSSAGLNLFWDRYGYRQDETHLWGQVDSPVSIACKWHGRPAHLDAPVTVIERRGCDLAPVDVRDSAHMRTLESFVWPDQVERLAQLRDAAALARRDPPLLDPESAGRWLSKQLAQRRPGCATVVFHSIMWWYLSEAERDAVVATIAAAGGRASTTAPLAWLRLELGGSLSPDLLLHLWPEDEEIALGRANPHGREVWWEQSADLRWRGNLR